LAAEPPSSPGFVQCANRRDSFASVETFLSHGDDSFELNPDSIDDYLKLFRELEKRAPRVSISFHLGSFTRDDEAAAHSLFASEQKFGFIA
jgi:hypothetical protein